MKHDMSRRHFMMSAALFSSVGFAPAFLTRAVEGAAPAIPGFKDDKVLVVVQLGGGNDGLNTIVPHSNDDYYRVRPGIGLKDNQLIRINDDISANAKLKGFMDLYNNGEIAIVQGVGYPNPDRSHFRSMEIWHTASDSNEYLGDGWIGRYFDNCCEGAPRPQVGVALQDERPQAFDGTKGFGVVFDDPKSYGWQPGKGAATPENFAHINAAGAPANDTVDFLRHVTSNAIMSSKEVREASERGKAPTAAGRGADPLQTVAALLRGNLETRIFYVSVSGFDTHANQLATHDRLLETVSNSLAKFQETLKHDGNADRVLTMVFSEFGRRVAQNASGGTDHGTAAPMFLVGSNVNAGVHGAMPSLTDLDNGDLKYTTDFRNVYSSVLAQWFNVDPGLVLGQTFQPIPIIA
ncbi:MAG: hypothetical protein AMXMBFR84_20050 [Candidatus Hydrogenedentota bacterium]